MPVSVETAVSGPFTPNGVAVSFPFDFKADSASEVIVVDEDGTPLSSALYSVALNAGEGGTVTFSTAPLLVDYAELYIVSEPAMTQLSDFGNSGPSFNPVSLTRALDRAAIRDLALQAQIDRAIKMPFGSTSLDVPADRAGQFLSFDVDGTPIVSSGTGADLGLRADLAASSGSALAGYLNSGTGAATRSVQAKLSEIIRSITDYGASTGGTAAANLAAIKAALAACSAGDVLDVPPGTFMVDTTIGLALAATVSTTITIRLRGNLQSNSQAIGVTPAPILNVTADNVTIEGDGKFVGPGTTNSVNTGTDETMPALVRVTGASFTMRGVTIDTPYKVGVQLYGCYHALIDGVKVTGGPTTYTDTSHFGIRAAGGGRHIFTGLRFFPGSDNGMTVQCLFGNSVNNCIFDAIHAYRPYEKVIYWFGSGNIAKGCEVIGNTASIPGTNVAGTIGAVFRFHGSFNKIDTCYTTDCGGGATFIDGTGNEVVNCDFLRCGGGAVAFTGTASLEGSRVDGSTFTYAALAGNLAADGLYMTSSYSGTQKQITVDNNTISGFSVSDPIAAISTRTNATAYGINSNTKPTVGNGRYYVAIVGGVSGGSEPTWNTTPGSTTTDGTITWVAVAYEGGQSEIRIVAASGKEITKSSFNDNNLSGGALSISLTYVINSTVGFNDLDASTHHMVENNCTAVRWLFNANRGAGTKTPQGMSATSVFVDFSYSGTATYDPASLADGAGVTTTVTVTGAALGDYADASFSLDLQGVSLKAWVSAADTVSVRFQNETGGVVDLGSGTIKARVQKG